MLGVLQVNIWNSTSALLSTVVHNYLESKEQATCLQPPLHSAGLLGIGKQGQEVGCRWRGHSHFSTFSIFASIWCQKSCSVLWQNGTWARKLHEIILRRPHVILHCSEMSVFVLANASRSLQLHDVHQRLRINTWRIPSQGSPLPLYPRIWGWDVHFPILSSIYADFLRVFDR